MRRPIFDAIKAARGKGFTQTEVAAIDLFLDRLDVPRETNGAAHDDDSEAWVDLAAPLIEEFEGYEKKLPDGGVQAYPDPGTGGKPWTIGIGSTTNENGQPIAPGTIWTRERAVARFKTQLAEFGDGVDKALASAKTSPAQKAALVSLAYNIGLGAFAGSTVLRKHRAGDYKGAADAFAMWNKAGGKVMNGLVRRREAEAKLYRSEA